MDKQATEAFTPSPPQEEKGPLSLLQPLQILYLSASFIPSTLFHLITTFQFSKLTSWSAFQHVWFGAFWSKFSPGMALNNSPSVSPILQKYASGVVLDIGPGSGEWVHCFSSAANNGNIVKIFGVEPNEEHHAKLRERVVNAGLEDVYTILGVGAQDLGTVGLGDMSVDTIVTVQCLCSVREPRRVIEELYPLLKRGGKWLVYEHVRTKLQGSFVGYWQKLLNYVWPIFLDGCSLTRPTDEWLIQAGEWESVDLKPINGEGKYDTIPHTAGVLVKK